MSKPPIFFLSFANNPDEPFLNLEREQEAIFQLLTPAANEQQIQIHHDSFSKIENIADFLRQYKNRVELFHYGGHANSEQIFLRDQPANAHGIALLLKEQKKLKLVFLNGCSTYQQVQLLLDLDIPAVIATSASIDNKNATLFAETFYKAAVDNFSIKEAFEHAAALIKAKTNHYPQSYRGTEIRDPGINALPWGLYYVKDNAVENQKLISPKKKTPFISIGFFFVISFSILAFLATSNFFPFNNKKTHITNGIKKTTLEYINKNFIKIKGGNYKIGLNANTLNQIYKVTGQSIPDPSPETTIRINSFQIGKHEVTEEEYHSFIIDQKHHIPKHWSTAKLKNYSTSAKPVANVTWEDATAYSNWLKEKLQVKEIRLPTEEEWEIAARGKTNNVFPWGNIYPETSFVNFSNTERVSVNSKNAMPSPAGLMHMGGNVAEWCEPSKHFKKVYCEGKKVVKGGSFNSTATELAIASYRCLESDHEAMEIGFRIVLIQ